MNQLGTLILNWEGEHSEPMSENYIVHYVPYTDSESD